MDGMRGGGGRMHHHYAQDYHGRNRARMDGGGGDGRFPSSRLIPPAAMPSLSSGQGYYTVESLQGATVLPPTQIAHPPPSMSRFPGEPFVVDDRIHDPRHFDISREHPAFVGRGGFHRLNPQAPIHHGHGHDPAFVMHPHRPPYVGGPRPTGFHPGFREQIPARRGPLPWAPDFDPYHHHRRGSGGSGSTGRIDSHDRFRNNQKAKVKKQVQKKVTPDAKSKGSLGSPVTQIQKGCASDGGPGWCSVCQIDCRTSDTLKKHLAGKRHKRQLESDDNGNRSKDGSEESKKDAIENEVPSECEKESTVSADPNPESVTDNPNPESVTSSEDSGMDGEPKVCIDTEPSETAVMHNDENTQHVTNEVAVTFSVTGDTIETIATGANLPKNDAESDELIEIPITCKDGEISKGATENLDSLLVMYSVQSKESPLGSNKRVVHETSNATSTPKKARIHSSQKNKPSRQVCELCNITYTNKIMLENHLQTEEHLANLNKSTGNPSFKDRSETEIASVEAQVQ